MKPIEFFMPMIPPTCTHQEKQVRVVDGKPVFYDPPAVKAARQKLTAHLAQHRPDKPVDTACRLFCKWYWPTDKHHSRGYRTTKPDTDNLQKLLKDCMTTAGFWKDDALVVEEMAGKYWDNLPGIYIRIEELP